MKQRHELNIGNMVLKLEIIFYYGNVNNISINDKSIKEELYYTTYSEYQL